jgi:hypothetical protein
MVGEICVLPDHRKIANDTERAMTYDPDAVPVQGSNPWYTDYDNIILLVRWLADQHESADECAYAVEKPWKYEDAFNDAVEAAKHER